MTFKQFMKAVFFAPADLINRLLFGYEYRDENTGRKEEAVGLIGLVISVAYIIGATISQIIADNRKTVALALWSAAAAATAAVLTVAFWPAALAAVTSFSIYGLSIASVFGTSFAASLVGTGVVAAALSSAAVLASSLVVNTISAIVGCFCKPTKPEDQEYNANDAISSKSQMRGLNADAGHRSQRDRNLETAPQHSQPLFSVVPTTDTPDEELLETARMSMTGQ